MRCTKIVFIYSLAIIFLTSLLHAEEKTHFTIAIDPEYSPFTQKNIDNEASGLLVDFWDLWAKKNNYTVSYKFYTWEESIHATEDGEVDFHSGTTKDRLWMHASKPIYELRTVLFTVKDKPIESVIDLTHKRIGTIDKYYGALVKNIVGGAVEIVQYDDYSPMIEALKSHEVDAVIDDLEALRYFFIKTGQLNYFQMVHNKQLQFRNKIYAITNRENAPMLRQINAGLDRLDLVDLVQLEEIWLPRVDDAFYNRKLKERVEYTVKEKEWMTTQKNLTVTGDPAWAEYTLNKDRNSYRGVAGDYIHSLAKKMTVYLTPLPIESWAELLATPVEERPDIIMGTMNDALKKLFLENYTFLEPYEAGPLVIIMNKNIRFITDLYDVKDKKIGMLSLQNYTQQVEFKYAEYDFYQYTKIRTLLDKVLKKELSAAILPLPDAILILSDNHYDTLDIVGKMDEKAYVNIGVLKTKPLLKNIVHKTLQSTALHYKQDILSKWTQKLNYIEKVDYTLTYTIAGLLSLLLLSTMYYARVIQQKHQEAESLMHKMEELALTDDLTGLPNKRAFNQNFEGEHKDKKTLGLLFIDIDYFKKYNDYYGHLKGDDVLKKISQILQTFTSEDVKVYRIGGEEFGLILYNYEGKSAVEYAENICQNISHANITHKDSPIGHLTISIGVSIGCSEISRHRLYQCADQALYAAKALGRNKVFLSDCFV